MGIPVGLCLAALLVMSGVVKAQTGTCQDCTSTEQCVTMNGVQGCGCGTSPTFENFGAAETCSDSSVTLSLSRCQLFEAGINVTALHLNNASCIGVVQNGILVFSVNYTHSSCGTTLQSNSTHLFYENSIHNGSGSSGLISRGSWVNFNFTCAYPIIQNLSMPMYFQASQGVLFRHIQDLGPYQISMLPYPNASFSAPYSGNVTLDVNQRIFVSVNVTGVDGSQIVTVLDHCWATPDENASNSISWNLILNDCPNTADGTVEVLQNGVGTSARFSFRMFTFTGVSEKLFLHCEVHLCQSSLGNCAQSCGSGGVKRRRRSLNYDQPASITMSF